MTCRSFFRLFLVAAAVYLTSGNSFAYPADALSEQETAAVKKGQILLQPDEDQALGWRAVAYLNTPPEIVWQVITDYNPYAQFMPYTVESVIENTTDHSALTHAVYHNPWPLQDVTMTLHHEHDVQPPHYWKMSWKSLEPQTTASFGYWKLTPYENGTLVVYDMKFTVNWVPKTLAQQASRGRLEEILRAVKARAAQIDHAHKTIAHAQQ